MDLAPGERSAALKALGKRLESLIYERFKSKEQFLGETGFYKANLHDIITGKVDPQYTTLLRLAKALKIPPEELITIPAKER